MTPTLLGRIQTRLFLLATVGVVWMLIISPIVLPLTPDGVELGDVYSLGYAALVLVAVIGIVWEFIYHGLQQFRWEKDWPTLFGLLTGINEGIVVYLVLRAGLPWDVGDVPGVAFVIMFATTWILVWLVANGPMRVLSLRWRFRGGRLL
ncbi:MAG: hypothetical protein ACE367_10915 [Acidimicrobiales bacterium]